MVGDFMEYISVIKSAILFFPVVCLILSLPFLIFHYRKYGSITFSRFLIVYSFFFYLLCIYFLVILPLPSKMDILNYEGIYYNLKPFFVVPEIFMSGEVNVVEPNTYVFLLNQKFLEPLFNILMTIPFGIYLRYYFKCGFFKTLFYSFLLSLFFELTQLTGLYFVYPHPYRLCDINDLINNTMGGLIGFTIVPLFSIFLPNRDRIDDCSYERGRFVSVLRHGVALLIDYFFIISISFGIMFFVGDRYFILVYLVLTFICFVLISYISSGYTFGKWFLKMRNVGINDDGSISIFKYFFKWLFFHLFLVNGWSLILIYGDRVGHISNEVWLVYLFVLFLFLVYCFICLIMCKDIFINKILGIDSVSYAQFDEDDYEI